VQGCKLTSRSFDLSKIPENPGKIQENPGKSSQNSRKSGQTLKIRAKMFDFKKWRPTIAESHEDLLFWRSSQNKSS